MKTDFQREGTTAGRTHELLSDIRFPVIEALLKDGLVDEVITHIRDLCMSINQTRSWKHEFDLTAKSEVALSGMNETILLLEKLRSLNNEIRNRKVLGGNFR